MISYSTKSVAGASVTCMATANMQHCMYSNWIHNMYIATIAW